MNSTQRRARILEILKEQTSCINASRLAAEFGVTRQIIVSDVALLRAHGHPIIADRRGYYLEKPQPEGTFETVICKHSADQVLDEFYAVVDNGATVLNVLIEHPIYGQISAELNIASRFDAEEFVEKVQKSHAAQLCDLTGGVHIHTLRASDPAAFARIRARLAELGILMEKEPGETP